MYIERFHSRGQHLCKFIGTKESVCIRKSSTPKGLVWNTNMAAVSLFWDTNMAAVTSCENTLYNSGHPCYAQLAAVKRVSADQCHMTVSRAQVHNSLR